MTTQTQLQPKDTLLRQALYGNAIFSGVSGLACVFAANPIADFLGINLPWAIAGIGVMLVGYAGLLWYNASRPVIDPNFGLFAVIADGLWVIASIILLVTNLVPFTPEAKWAVAIVAMVVDVFATVQFVGWKRIRA